MRPHAPLALALTASLTVHCGPGSTGGTDARATDAAPDDARAADASLDAAPSPDADTTDAIATDAPRDDAAADGGAPASVGPFRYGINLGYWGSQYSDEDLGLLASRSGASSTRPKYSEYFFDRWGYDVRTHAMATDATNGLSHHVAFLIGPSAAHSTAPSGADDGTLEQYIPRNLYEPITQADGTINPDNYWAAFVYRTVQTYHAWVDTWEVWNEPDFVADYHVVDSWRTQPPTAAQLVRFHGDVFAYVRMLRVTRVAARLADPAARVAVGGLGYPPFLAAVLRYTDNPAGGAVTADYPATGGAYFDVVSMHYYPLYGPGPSSDEGVDGFVALRDQFAAVLHDAGVSGKAWLCTETGASSRMFGTQPGGVQYAADYDPKVMVTADALGFDAVHWFDLSNGSASSTNPYDFMGWYTNLPSAMVSTAARSDTGEAQRTLAQLVGDAAYDPAATAALALPATARGAAFRRRADGALVLALWARTHGASESASVSVTVPAAGSGFDAYAWDAARSGTHTTVAASGGHATLALRGDPQYFVARP